jgi:peroxiredoxin Q/BCP
MIKIGKKAPDFTLTDQDGKLHMYFYPKDDTPGCTKEACSFRDNFKTLKNKGIEVLGVSADDESSHIKFRQKYQLPFNLLADTDKEAVKKYGVWVEKNMYGRKKWGIARKTFLIDEEGKVSHIFSKVKTEIHADEVLDKLSG